jgi:hypothetical protein
MFYNLGVVFKKLSNFLRNNLLLVILILISCYVCYKNYVPGTFLTGWDTLHPEFNFKMYWGRIIDGVWQEHQGLGAVGSQAHASEIPRIAILSILGLFLRMNQLRYAYAFLMLILGPAGIYFLVKELLKGDNSSGSFPLNFAGFSGGLFYLLNLGTLQHFYVPLEMFLTHYGFIGFVFLFAIRFFDSGKRKDLLLFLIFSLLITPQAHTATLFYAYLLIFIVFLGVLSLTYVIKKIQKPAPIIKRASILVSFTLLINSFWLLPNIYFVLNHGEEIKLSKIQHLFSTEAFLANQRFGNLKDVAILKNFLFTWGEHVGNAKFGDLLQEWTANLNEGAVMGIGYTLFIFIILGLIAALVTRHRYSFAMSAVFFVSMFFLFSVNPPFGFLFVFFQDHVPMFQEAFRFPFTKFSILLMMSYGVFFGYFSFFITNLINKMKPRRYSIFTNSVIFVLILEGLVIFMKPAFEGYLISPSMKIAIPTRYFELFDHLGNKNEFGRVANLPTHTFWGWVYHNWDPLKNLGYQGAGFLWFGIKQPLMDREFDRWNLLNESYYFEISRAVYSQNPILLKQVMDKYKIGWVLLDESILVPGADQKQLFYEQTKKTLSLVPGIRLEKDFGEGLHLYEYKPEKPFSLYETSDSFYSVSDGISKEGEDPIYSVLGNYVKGGEDLFPYVGITDYDESVKSDNIVSDQDKIIFKPLNKGSGGLYFNNQADIYYDLLAGLNRDELSLQVMDSLEVGRIIGSVNVADFELYKIFEIGNRLFYFDPKTITEKTVSLGKSFINPTNEVFINAYKDKYKDVEAQFNYSILERCSEAEKNASYELNKFSDGFTLTGENVRACVTVGLSDLLGDQVAEENDVVKITFDGNSRIPGKDICVFNHDTGLCENFVLDDGSNYFVLKAPSTKYSLRFYVDARGSSIPISSTFRNIKIYPLTKSKAFLLKPEGYNQTSENVVIPEDIVFYKTPGLSGEVSKMLSDPRPCNGVYDEKNYGKSKSGDSAVYTSSKRKSICDSFWFTNINHNSGLVLEVESRNISGSPLRMCLTNEFSKRCDIYIELPKSNKRIKSFYLIPPMGSGFGYTVNFSNITFGDETSSNELSYLALTQIPYDYLKSLHRDPTNSLVDDKRLLIYNQAYEKGWVALCGLKVCNGRHVMVNNWSNGWVFEKDFDVSIVKVVFWPQLLEYLGMILCIGSFICVAVKGKAKTL